MKTLKLLLGILSVTVLSLGIAQAGPHTIKLKAGDTAYVCGCGAKCECQVLAKKGGKCSCGHDLAKVTISKVEKEKAFFTADGKEQSVKVKGKFACACSGDCCEIISQKAAKCQCGKDMAKVPEDK